MTEHGRLVARPADRTPVERANDQALEYAILAARVAAVLLALSVLVSVFAYAWTWDHRWAVTAVVSAVFCTPVGWWGWWQKGNADWRQS